MSEELVVADKARATVVMDEINGIIKLAETVANKSVAKLSKLLVEAKQGAYWADSFKTEDDYIKTLPYSRAQYYNLIGIGLHLGFLPEETVSELGIKKCEALVRISKHSPSLTDEWVDKARNSRHEDFLHDVRTFFKKKDDDNAEEIEWIRIKASKGQADIIREAMSLAEKMLGSDKSQAQLVELICADFMSGSLDDGSGRLSNRDGFLIKVISNLSRQLSGESINALIGALANVVESENDQH